MVLIEHYHREIHTYCLCKSEAAKLAAWMIDCEYWFEAEYGTGGDYAIICAVHPDQIERALGLKIDTSEAA